MWNIKKILITVLSFLLLFAISCSNEDTTGEDMGTSIPEMWRGKYLDGSKRGYIFTVTANSISLYDGDGGSVLYTIDVSDSKTKYLGNNTWHYYDDAYNHGGDSTIKFKQNEKGQRVLLENPVGIEYTFIHEDDYK